MVVKGKNIVVGCIAALVAAAVVYVCFAGVGAILVSSDVRYRPVKAVETQSKVFAITLDGEQNSYNLDSFVSFLGRYHAPATVFITGNYAREYSRDLDVVHRAGHSVQSLGKNGDDLAQLSIGELTDNIKQSSALIEKNCWAPPTILRYLGDNMGDDKISALKSCGYTVVGTGIDRDHYKLTGGVLGEKMAEQLCDGIIVRFSLDIKDDVAAMDRFIAIAIQKGYSPIPLEKMLLQGEYSVDAKGVQHPR